MKKKVRDPAAFRATMADLRLSQRSLARLAQCSRGTVYKLIAQGGATDPATAGRIARSLQGSAADLFVDAMSSPTCQSVTRQDAA